MNTIPGVASMIIVEAMLDGGRDHMGEVPNQSEIIDLYCKWLHN